MAELFDKVKIKDKDITGIIVDISGENVIVESDSTEHKDGAYGGVCPLYDCKLSDLENISNNA